MIRFDDVSISYDGETVLADVRLAVPRGGRAALMGPSGCGKSSLLNLAAGLAVPSSGAVTVNTVRLSYVFQEPRLLPWLTAAQNVNAVLGGKRATLSQAVAWLQRVGLGCDGDKYPSELSGGMAQRVNLARALAYDGDILLLDEPFRGLDEARRSELIALLKDCAQEKTLLLATHDRAEAEALCDMVFLYDDKTFLIR